MSELIISDLVQGTWIGSGWMRLEGNTHEPFTNWLPGQQVSRQTYHRVSGLGQRGVLETGFSGKKNPPL